MKMLQVSTWLLSVRLLFVVIIFSVLTFAIISGFMTLPLTRNLAKYLVRLQLSLYYCVSKLVICTCYLAHDFVHLMKNLAEHLLFEWKTGYRQYSWSGHNFTTFTYGTSKTIYNSNAGHGHMAILSSSLYAPQQVNVSVHSFTTS